MTANSKQIQESTLHSARYTTRVLVGVEQATEQLRLDPLARQPPLLLRKARSFAEAFCRSWGGATDNPALSSRSPVKQRFPALPDI